MSLAENAVPEDGFVLVLIDSYYQMPYETRGIFPDEDSAWAYYEAEYDGCDASVVKLIELDH